MIGYNDYTHRFFHRGRDVSLENMEPQWVAKCHLNTGLNHVFHDGKFDKMWEISSLTACPRCFPEVRGKRVVIVGRKVRYE